MISYIKAGLFLIILLSFPLVLARLPLSFLIFILVTSIYGLTSIFVAEQNITVLRDLVIIAISVPFIFRYLNEYYGQSGRHFTIFCYTYFYSLVVLTFFADGFLFEDVLLFNFSHGSSFLDRNETYSLGVSQIYGIFALVFLADFLRARRCMVLALLSFLVSLYLTFIGGGRGEILACLLMVFYLLTFSKKRFLQSIMVSGVVVTGVSYALVTLDLESLFDSFVFLQRFSELSLDNVSSRDVLLFESLHLLYENSHCLVFGCGFGFFQSYFSYDIGLHPHNSIMEFIITFGLIIFIMVVLRVLYGVYIHSKSFGGVDVITVLFSFSFFDFVKVRKFIQFILTNRFNLLFR